MNVDDCFKQGLLKKEQPDTNKMQESLNIAKHFIEHAEGNYNIEFYKFHGNARLFRGGMN